MFLDNIVRGIEWVLILILKSVYRIACRLRHQCIMNYIKVLNKNTKFYCTGRSSMFKNTLKCFSS